MVQNQKKIGAGPGQGPVISTVLLARWRNRHALCPDILAALNQERLFGIGGYISGVLDILVVLRPDEGFDLVS